METTLEKLQMWVEQPVENYVALKTFGCPKKSSANENVTQSNRLWEAAETLVLSVG